MASHTNEQRSNKHKVMCRTPGCQGASLAELRRNHGTPSEFEDAVLRAWADGFCNFGEAQAAIDKYRAEFYCAPEVA